MSVCTDLFPVLHFLCNNKYVFLTVKNKLLITAAVSSDTDPGAAGDTWFTLCTLLNLDNCTNTDTDGIQTQSQTAYEYK